MKRSGTQPPCPSPGPSHPSSKVWELSCFILLQSLLSTTVQRPYTVFPKSHLWLPFMLTSTQPLASSLQLFLPFASPETRSHIPYSLWALLLLVTGNQGLMMTVTLVCTLEGFQGPRGTRDRGRGFYRKEIDLQGNKLSSPLLWNWKGLLIVETWAKEMPDKQLLRLGPRFRGRQLQAQSAGDH